MKNTNKNEFVMLGVKTRIVNLYIGQEEKGTDKQRRLQWQTQMIDSTVVGGQTIEESHEMRRS